MSREIAECDCLRQPGHKQSVAGLPVKDDESLWIAFIEGGFKIGEQKCWGKTKFNIFILCPVGRSPTGPPKCS
jgi:hypothetical protein